MIQTTVKSGNSGIEAGSGLKVGSNVSIGTLFERLGGDDGIKMLVEKIYSKIEVDPMLA